MIFHINFEYAILVTEIALPAFEASKHQRPLGGRGKALLKVAFGDLGKGHRFVSAGMG